MSVTHVMYSRVLVTVCVAHARVQRSQPLSRTAVVTRRRCTLSHRATLGWTYFIPHRTLKRAQVYHTHTLIAFTVTLFHVVAEGVRSSFLVNHTLSTASTTGAKSASCCKCTSEASSHKIYHIKMLVRTVRAGPARQFLEHLFTVVRPSAYCSSACSDCDHNHNPVGVALPAV